MTVCHGADEELTRKSGVCSFDGRTVGILMARAKVRDSTTTPFKRVQSKFSSLFPWSRSDRMGKLAGFAPPAMMGVTLC